MTRLLGLAALSLAVAGCAGRSMFTKKDDLNRDQAAQKVDLRDQYRGNSLSSTDQPFVRNSLQLTAFEIKASKLALEKTEHPEVKRIAARLIKDDEATREKLLKIMHDRGDTMPNDINFDQQQILDQLQAMSGSDFDIAYVQHMQDSHRYLVTAGHWELQYGKNDDVKVLANKTVGRWQSELRMLAGEDNMPGGSRMSSERE